MFLRLQNLGIGILVAPLIGFLESIAIAKAFGEFTYIGASIDFHYHELPTAMFWV